jgi:hypothetical protein
VQAVAELAFLDVADEAVDADHGFRRAGRGVQTQILQHARRLCLVADAGDQSVAPGRVQPFGGGIFVQQPFERQQSLRHGGGGHGRRHMAQRQRADAALGLRGLARIVDDEGIDNRHGACQRLGPAVLRQGDRLAGQPFQRAMRADMDQSLHPLRAQPQVEGDIGMGGHARHIVVVGVAGGDFAAFGLQGDDGLAAPESGEVEIMFRAPHACARSSRRVAGRVARATV